MQINKEKENKTVSEKGNKESSVGAFIVRIIMTAIVLGLAAFLTPGFHINGLGTLIIATIIIIIMSFAIESMIGVGANPFGRGLAGFAVSVIVLIITSKLIDGFSIGLFSAIFGSFLIGIINAVIPSKTF